MRLELHHYYYLFFALFPFVCDAGSLNKGEPCSQSNNKLQFGTFQFWDQCNSQTYCSSGGTCEAKGCRRDDFPFGYATGSKSIPDKCPTGQFCPDEEDQCLPLLAVDSPCQLNRDDECEGPPNFAELSDQTGQGRNVNGSVCLNYVCMWANATSGSDCVVENTPYIAYDSNGEFIDIVSRDNCVSGLYCDAAQKTCMNAKNLGATCGADKECQSWNCLASSVCGASAAAPRHFSVFVYVIVAAGIFGGMFGTLIGLFVLHKKKRDEEREKRVQYWREQNAFHRNLLQMRETAEASIRSLNTGSANNTIYGQDHASTAMSEAILGSATPVKGSGLRYSDGSSDYFDGPTNY
jgi:hypothetical protein